MTDAPKYKPRRAHGKCRCGARVTAMTTKVDGLQRFPRTAVLANRYWPKSHDDMQWFEAVSLEETGELVPIEGDAAYLPCPSCKAIVLCPRVRGTFANHKRCDARCTNAKGHTCECSCGGANHGKGDQ